MVGGALASSSAFPCYDARGDGDSGGLIITADHLGIHSRINAGIAEEHGESAARLRGACGA
jgi:hypothetical protein